MKPVVLKELLSQKGISAQMLMTDLRLSKQVISHYLNGRRKKAGRLNSRRIDAYLVQLGLVKPRRPRRVLCGVTISSWVLRASAREINMARNTQGELSCPE